MYKVAAKDKSLWEETFSDNSNNVNPLDKPFLKIVFYAACNGGSISSDEALLRHLLKTYPHTQQIDTFVKNVKSTKIYNDLHNLGSFWQKFEGRIHVPTRSDKVIRKDRSNNPQSYKLSSPVYCSFEVLFIMEIIQRVFMYFKNNNITILQGMHDGIIFYSLESCELSDLET